VSTLQPVPAPASSLALVSQPVAGLRAPPPSSALLGRLLARLACGIALVGSPIVLLSAWMGSTMERSPWALASIVWVWLGALISAFIVGRIGRSHLALRLIDVDSVATTSTVVCAFGVAVAGPLTLHALITSPIWIMSALTGASSVMEGFNDWVCLSVVGTLHVHLAFAIALAQAARRIAAGERGVKVTLWPAVVLSCVPGVLIVFPPLVVWITGFVVATVFVKAAEAWHNKDREQQALAER
jgi:hypothetical protein